MRGVRLWEVKNAVFERRNRRDHSLCPLMGGVRLREVSVSGGSTVLSGLPKNANVKTEPNMTEVGHSEGDMEP